MRTDRRLGVTSGALLTALLLVGCVPQPVQWDAEVASTPGALADSLRLTFGADAAPQFTGV
jgi:hypothetical protein